MAGNPQVALSFEIAAGVAGILEQSFTPSAGKVVVDTIIDEAAKTFAQKTKIPLPIVFEAVERYVKPNAEIARSRIDNLTR